MSSHEDFRREGAVKPSSDRAFGLVFAMVFALIALWPLLDDAPPRWWALAVAGGFACLALAAPKLLAPANRLWSGFGLLLGRVVNPLVMGLLFYLVVTPTGLIMRAFGKDPLRLARDPDAASYWIERTPPGPAPGGMPRQF